MRGKNKHIMRGKNTALESWWSQWSRWRVSGDREALRRTCRASYYLVVHSRVQPSAELGSVSSALCHLFGQPGLALQNYFVILKCGTVVNLVGMKRYFYLKGCGCCKLCGTAFFLFKLGMCPGWKILNSLILTFCSGGCFISLWLAFPSRFCNTIFVKAQLLKAIRGLKLSEIILRL